MKHHRTETRAAGPRAMSAPAPVQASPTREALRGRPHAEQVVMLKPRPDADAPAAAAPGDPLTRLWQQFEAETGSKTFYSGALSWLNNLVASGEKLHDAVTGDTSDPTWWGCADAAPALLRYFQQNYRGGDYTFELLTSRNLLGLQHNQVVAVPVGGGVPRVFDPWAGGEVPYGFNFDDTLLPVGQVLELAVTQSVEATGHGQGKAVTGNQLLRIDTAIAYYRRLLGGD